VLVDGDWVFGLLQKYRDELSAFSQEVQRRYWRMCQVGHGAVFSDFEGEVLYCLVRELKPNVFFEISPDCGYSTLYAYEALTANGSGKLFSFEIEENKHGRSTSTVIRENAIRDLTPDRFELIIGDAAQTVAAYPDPDIVLIDSCHERWFAEWYWEHLLPRVREIALVQDILFFDRIEPSTEASWLLDTLTCESVPFMSLGLLERRPEAVELRAEFAPRRPHETNSILLGGSNVDITGLAPAWAVNTRSAPPDDKQAVLRLETSFAQTPRKGGGHRELATIARFHDDGGELALASHYWIKAVAWALDEAPRNRGKGLSELFVQALRERRIGRAAGVMAVSAVYCPAAIPRSLRRVGELMKQKAAVIVAPAKPPRAGGK
jgi:predicted O-methyltransferase YrrM